MYKTEQLNFNPYVNNDRPEQLVCILRVPNTYFLYKYTISWSPLQNIQFQVRMEVNNYTHLRPRWNIDVLHKRFEVFQGRKIRGLLVCDTV